MDKATWQAAVLDELERQYREAGLDVLRHRQDDVDVLRTAYFARANAPVMLDLFFIDSVTQAPVLQLYYTLEPELAPEKRPALEQKLQEVNFRVALGSFGIFGGNQLCYRQGLLTSPEAAVADTARAALAEAAAMLEFVVLLYDELMEAR